MNCFDILEIAATTDVRAIKKAYAAMIKLYHPEDDPSGFQRINEAYQQALKYAGSGKNSRSHILPVMQPTLKQQSQTARQSIKEPTVPNKNEQIKGAAQPKETINFKDILMDNQEETAHTKETINFEHIISSEEKKEEERIEQLCRQFDSLFRNSTDKTKLINFFETEEFKKNRTNITLLIHIIDFFEHSWTMDIAVWRHVKTLLHQGETTDNAYQWLLRRYEMAYEKREQTKKEKDKEQKEKWKRLFIAAAVLAFGVLIIYVKMSPVQEKKPDIEVPQEVVLSNHSIYIDDIFETAPEQSVNEADSVEECLFHDIDYQTKHNVVDKIYSGSVQGISYNIRYPEVEGIDEAEIFNEKLYKKACDNANETLHQAQDVYGDKIEAEIYGEYYITMDIDNIFSIIFVNKLKTGEEVLEKVYTASYSAAVMKAETELLETDVLAYFKLKDETIAEDIQFYATTYGFTFIRELPEDKSYCEVSISWAAYWEIYNTSIQGKLMNAYNVESKDD